MQRNEYASVYGKRTEHTRKRKAAKYLTHVHKVLIACSKRVHKVAAGKP